jgi:uncharacterized protein YhfF
MSVEEFWSEFCTSSGVSRDEAYQVWYFGNTQEMALELAGLVVSGTKTATSSLASVNEIHPENAPVMDVYSVVTDLVGEPICVIQTLEIRHLPFDEVDAEFAADEGEGDRSLAHWQHVHQRYFEREASELGLEFDARSIVCCERFRLLYAR